MRKKRLVIAAIATVVLVAMLSSIAGAWLTTSATATASGRTGYVRIQTYDVTLSDKFQPGDTQFVWLRVHNNGSCPVKIIRATAKDVPSYLAVSFVKTPTAQVITFCQSVYFKMLVHMFPSATPHQNTAFSFQIQFDAQNTPTVHPTVGTGGP